MPRRDQIELGGAGLVAHGDERGGKVSLAALHDEDRGATTGAARRWVVCAAHDEELVSAWLVVYAAAGPRACAVRPTPLGDGLDARPCDLLDVSRIRLDFVAILAVSETTLQIRARKRP